MALWWIVNQEGGKPSIVVQEAGDVITARLKAKLVGHEGDFAEAHRLDTKMAKKVPKDLVGRVLSQKEAMRLLKKLG